ncbi:family 1 encapsulin nanocompartment shell protein [Mesosutterella sp. AGMB02718]|uniref:Family 1 encapsulin nanocompartment shell protein n=1 Tax=Mesosutterella faecium TaxID=2925194 RepID=A0ABT7IPW5_9BURK|nr:family 1 encapsulin nanocompartment shell protein [Mesosutterella sp. AGMB02718]MDL2060431.1 family 1 encapsulin nanocompartment shell protein [Mesosutterella sp. AGMB02718]
MDYLMRGDSKLSDAQWKAVDETVVNAARSVLTGRKFLNIYGPLGAGVPAVEVKTDGTKRIAVLAEISSDFTLSWRDLETAERLNLPFSYSDVASAAVGAALQEDRLIFLGDEEKGCAGLLGTAGKTMKLAAWDKDENAFAAVASGLQYMLANRAYGSKVLVVSPDVFASLQRIQPGTGALESTRIAALIEGKIYQTPILPAKTALLIAPDEQNMDLAIGQDLVTAYLGASEMNHDFRVFETVLLRLKNTNAVVAFRG